MAKLKIAEVFAGVGGVTFGFAETGLFESVFLNDIDPVARKIYLHNFHNHADRYSCQNIKNITSTHIFDIAGGKVDGLLGCPPCQGLSSVGSRDSNDIRNELITEMSRLALSVRPKFIVIENVPALLKSKYYFEFINALKSRYNFVSGVLNAAEYGVPQLRRRAIIIGYRKNLGVLPSLPKSSHGANKSVFEYSLGKYVDLGSSENAFRLNLSRDSLSASKDLITIEAALADLPSCLNPDEIDKDAQYKCLANNEYQKLMRKGSGRKVGNHTRWDHTDDMVNRIKDIKPGFCPFGQGLNRNKRYFSQAYGRLHPKGMSRTITTYFHNPGSGRFIHYSEDRTLTVREALRIQSFPDRFRMPADILRRDAERVTGNAFPPILAKTIAEHINAELSAA